MIEERLSMYDDLMEKDPKMMRIRAESEARGEARGEEKGRAKELRIMILAFMQKYYPALLRLTSQRVKQMTDPDELRELFQQLLAVPNEAAARSLLTSST